MRLILDIAGEWHVKQLPMKLQNIFERHKNHFNGELVPLFEGNVKDAVEEQQQNLTQLIWISVL